MAAERLTDEELAALWQESEEADWSNTRLEATQVLRLVAEVRASRELLAKAELLQKDVGDWYSVALRYGEEKLALRQMLERLEWAGDDPESFEEIEHHEACPVCKRREYLGHAPGCALAALLGREDQAQGGKP